MDQSGRESGDVVKIAQLNAVFELGDCLAGQQGCTPDVQPLSVSGGELEIKLF
ncbi:MAG: hypothetical protein AB7P03_17685 [Kofleriaceae bacterium]